MITALAGATEIHLVVRGKYTVVDMGEMTPEIYTSLAAIVIITVALHYHVKGAFCIGLVFGTVVYWIYLSLIPILLADPYVNEDFFRGERYSGAVVQLIFELYFINILTLNGLARAMSGNYILHSLYITLDTRHLTMH